MIYVFKTFVETKNDVRKLSRFLNDVVLNGKWNFDLEDCDRILRIDSRTDIVETIIKGFNNRGYGCEELT